MSHRRRGREGSAPPIAGPIQAPRFEDARGARQLPTSVRFLLLCMVAGFAFAIVLNGTVV